MLGFNKYHYSYIYKIVCLDPHIDDFYIGSTIHLNSRCLSHIKNTNDKKKKIYDCKLYTFIRDSGGHDNWKMQVIKLYKCENRKELVIEEQKYIDELKPSLNTTNSYTTKEEQEEKKKKWQKDNKERIKERTKKWKEDNKEKIKEQNKKKYENNKEKINEKHKKWRQDNKEKMKELQKKWHQDNKEKCNEQSKKHYEDNKEKYKEKNKKHYKDNKEIIAAKAKKWYQENKEIMKEKIECECGSVIRKDEKTRHNKTEKHQSYLNNLSS